MKKKCKKDHIFAVHNGKQYYCPDCGLCAEIETAGGKKIIKSWFEIR